MTKLSDTDLLRARDLGAASYLSAYAHLMARHLGIDDSDTDAINAMALQMAKALALGTEAAWCALMSDRNGMNNALARLQKETEALAKPRPAHETEPLG
jgi:hypothetical protein